MNAIEFTARLNGEGVLQIPPEIAEKLPKHGNARVIVLTDDDPDDGEWRQASYEQLFRDDDPEDSVYDFA